MVDDFGMGKLVYLERGFLLLKELWDDSPKTFFVFMIFMVYPSHFIYYTFGEGRKTKFRVVTSEEVIG